MHIYHILVKLTDHITFYRISLTEGGPWNAVGTALIDGSTLGVLEGLKDKEGVWLGTVDSSSDTDGCALGIAEGSNEMDGTALGKPEGSNDTDGCELGPDVGCSEMEGAALGLSDDSDGCDEMDGP